MDDGKAIMEEMAGSNSLDDPNYILKNLSLIPAVRPEEQSSYNKAKDAQVIVQSQVAFLSTLALEGIVASMWEAGDDGTSIMPVGLAATSAAASLSVEKSHPVIGVLGCGQVGAAVLRCLLELGWPPSLLALCARDATAAVARFRALGVATTPHVGVLAARARILVIAVGPTHFEALAHDISGTVPHNSLVISAVGAMSLAKIRAVTRGSHVVRTHLEPSLLRFKWDVQLRTEFSTPAPSEPGAEPDEKNEGDDGMRIEKTVDGAFVKVRTTPSPTQPKRNSLSDLSMFLKETRMVPETSATVLEAAASHLTQEADDILHTFVSIERFYSEGLGVSREAARLNARRAILGVIPGPETAAAEHEGASSAAQKLRAAVTHAHDDALTHSPARKILQVRAAEEAEAATSEDGPRERKPIEVLAELLVRLEQQLYPSFHRIIAKQLRLTNIPSENPDDAVSGFLDPPPPQPIDSSDIDAQFESELSRRGY